MGDDGLKGTDISFFGDFHPESVRCCEVCKYLISAGADLEVKEFQNENTSLHLAADVGSRETMSLLLAAGATVDPCNSQNATPLMLAARGGFSTAVRLLLDHGSNVHLRDQS